VGGTIAGGLVVLVGMSVLSRVFCFSKGNHDPIVSSSERNQQDDIQENRESAAEDSDTPLPPQRD
jgi:hypothetical protein